MTATPCRPIAQNALPFPSHFMYLSIWTIG
jgi:hypothetical protein